MKDVRLLETEIFILFVMIEKHKILLDTCIFSSVCLVEFILCSFVSLKDQESSMILHMQLLVILILGTEILQEEKTIVVYLV